MKSDLCDHKRKSVCDKRKGILCVRRTAVVTVRHQKFAGVFIYRKIPTNLIAKGWLKRPWAMPNKAGQNERYCIERHIKCMAIKKIHIKFKSCFLCWFHLNWRRIAIGCVVSLTFYQSHKHTTALATATYASGEIRWHCFVSVFLHSKTLFSHMKPFSVQVESVKCDDFSFSLGNIFSLVWHTAAHSWDSDTTPVENHFNSSWNC